MSVSTRIQPKMASIKLTPFEVMQLQISGPDSSDFNEISENAEEELHNDLIAKGIMDKDGNLNAHTEAAHTTSGVSSAMTGGGAVQDKQFWEARRLTKHAKVLFCEYI